MEFNEFEDENESQPFDVNFRATQRGFVIAEFQDVYGNKCSLQKSSSAMEDRIWFGVHSERMHLNQSMVEALLPALQHFVETGELPE